MTTIGAQSRPYGAKKPKKANKSNFNTGLSAGKNKTTEQKYLNISNDFCADPHSFPCTFDGVLHYQCVENMTEIEGSGCRGINATHAVCNACQSGMVRR